MAFHYSSSALCDLFGSIGTIYYEYQTSLKYKATHDDLTNLLEHSSFHSLGNRLLNEAKSDNDPASLVMLDIDRFKKINDNLGHKQGDVVLKQVSNLITDTTRGSDIVGRYGGEEFTVFFPDTNKERARKIADRIRKNIADEKNKIPSSTTVSGGVSNFPSDGSNLDQLIDLADGALYKAKEQGRNKICVTGSMSKFTTA